MKNNLPKLLALVLAMALSLTACGGDKPAETTETDPSAASTEAADSSQADGSAAASTSESPSVPDESIKEPVETKTVYLMTSMNTGGSLVVYEYDAFGNMILSGNSSYGQVTPVHEYTYDDESRILTDTEYKSNGSVKVVTTYTYDAAGNLLSVIGRNPTVDGTSSRVEYTYDDAGNQITKLEYDRIGSITSSYSYTYDAVGNQLSVIRNTRDGKSYTDRSYTYDSAGNVLSDVSYYQDGREHEHVEYRYDDAGNQIEKLWRDSSGTVYSYIDYTYDDSGNLLTQRNYHIGTKDTFLTYFRENTYDEAGNMLTSDISNYDGGMGWHKEYVYDDMGNMLIERIYEGIIIDEALVWSADYSMGVTEWTYEAFEIPA